MMIIHLSSDISCFCDLKKEKENVLFNLVDDELETLIKLNTSPYLNN